MTEEEGALGVKEDPVYEVAPFFLPVISPSPQSLFFTDEHFLDIEESDY